MTQIEETIWFGLVAEWRNALSRALAAQVQVNDTVDASIDGIRQFPPRQLSATAEDLWADEARKRSEMESFIEAHRAVSSRQRMPLDA